jgi:voltage-gated potassium channel
MGAIIAVLGIGMFALPTGILGAGFIEELDRRKKTQVGPPCGRELAG